jgi:hypothetical protein
MRGAVRASDLPELKLEKRFFEVVNRFMNSLLYWEIYTLREMEKEMYFYIYNFV